MSSAKYRRFGLADLDAGVGIEDTSITVGDVVSPFPATPFYVTVRTGNDSEPEVMRVTAVSGNVFTVVRGELGTTPVTHNAGNTVYEGTDEMKALAVYRQLATSPQGVIVRLDGHFMVFTGTSLAEDSFPHWEDYADWTLQGYSSVYPDPVEPELASDDLGQAVHLMSTLYPATSFEQGFTVCDPASSTPETGADVQFTNCYSFNRSDQKRLFEVESIWVVGP